MKSYDIVIVGAGLAGLTAALELSQDGFKIALIEKNEFPRHKVCGEYISNEVRPYLHSLGIDLSDVEEISELEYSSSNGCTLKADLPLGGFGISRYTLDKRMWELCKESHIDCLQFKVSKINYSEEESGDYPFFVDLSDSKGLRAKLVMAAHGKRSALDHQLRRSFIAKRSPWVAFKEHYNHPTFPEGRVELHSFKGGYCGLSRTENKQVNLCFLIHKDRLSQGASRESLEKVLRENPQLDQFLNDSEALFNQPLSISQISFGSKRLIENHILCIGDSAGLIHPLCGNGMAMAISAARSAARKGRSFLQGEISRKKMEREYAAQWRQEFQLRLLTGRYIQSLIQREILVNWLVPRLKRRPNFLKRIIELTHGKTLAV